MNNIETVKKIYEAFGRQDLGAILAVLRDDVSWDAPFEGTKIPWIVSGRGHATATRFFQALGEHVTLEHFAVKGLVGDGNVVVGLVDVTLVARATGKRVVEIDEAHVWRFDDQGKVASFRHCIDTQKHLDASR